MALDRNIQLKVSLSDTELLQILRDRAADLHGRPRYLLANSATANGKSDVVACFDPTLDSVTLTGHLNRHRPVQFTLKRDSQTYQNFIRLFLKELRSISAAEELAESVSVGGDATRAVQELTDHLEAKLGSIVPKQEMREVGAEVEKTLSESSRCSQLDEIPETIDVYSADFEATSEAGILEASERLTSSSSSSAKRKLGLARRSLLQRLRTKERSFRIVESHSEEPRPISGFLSVEIEEFGNGVAAEDALVAAGVKQNVWLIGTPSVEVVGQRAMITAEVHVPSTLLDSVEFGIHWGCYGESLAEPWCDEEVSIRDIEAIDGQTVRIRKVIVSEKSGCFGVSFWAMPLRSGERQWLSLYGQDTVFNTNENASAIDVEVARDRLVEQAELQTALLRALDNYDNFVRTVNKLCRGGKRRHISRVLYEATRYDTALRQIVSEYYQRILVALSNKPRAVALRRLETVHAVLNNLGLGEIVFIAPEGPHAIAGGLAQVIVGLSSALNKQGIYSTIVSPLYEEAQGSKHRSAEELLREGVEICGRRVIPTELGELRIPFGPTRNSDDGSISSPPMVNVATVYCAENESIRLLLIRHRRLANRLYAGADSEDQLRRAIFLSRGTLELIKDRRFGVSPHVLVTNDWLSALVPVFLKSDARYSQDPVLQNVESMHLLHNCGRDYQGRFFTNQFGVDLFPLLGLSGAHYFGLSDPADISSLNLTAGAVFHAGRGILAVSRPYAQQLLTDDGGEMLQHLFRARRDSLFGISNGIDLSALRSTFLQLGAEARVELGLEPLKPVRKTKANLVRRMLVDKLAAKQLLQKSYGLSESSSAVIISLVGRLTEQKGIQLLSGVPTGGSCSVMEAILRRHPEAQFLVGGPPTAGDPAMESFGAVLKELEERYPGRVRAVLSFIPHRSALQMTLGSDLFLMPSRFEPGGITQLEALACGAVVVARRVGGLAATLIDAHQDRERGNSFLFSDFSPEALERALERALQVLSSPRRHQALLRQALLAENDWSDRVPKYVAVLQHVAGVFNGAQSYPYLVSKRHLLGTLKA